MQSSCLMPNITSKGTGTPGTAGAWLTHVWGFLWGGPGSAGGLFLGSEMRRLFSYCGSWGDGRVVATGSGA